MRLTAADCRARMAAARVARMATVGPDGQPHLVPISFALIGETPAAETPAGNAPAGDRLVTAIDQKPKSTANLRRVRNIADNPRVSLLCDHYDDDWTQLWWVRADGHAEIVAPGKELLDALVAKHPQYLTDPPAGPFIVITVTAWSGWTATAP